YGVLLLGQLAQAHGQEQEQELTSASDLAAALHMAPSVVSNLLKSFREHGLLESRRGAAGGYRLCRPPEQISLLTILAAIDGPVQLTDCAAVELASACEYEDVCTSRSPLLAVNQRIIDMLSDLTLDEIQRSDTAHAAGSSAQRSNPQPAAQPLDASD
ncbi:MAG: hypothetical protein DRQ55_00695, partial [Planctomycetota bacterium]